MDRVGHLATGPCDVDDVAAPAHQHAREHRLHGVHIGEVFRIHRRVKGGGGEFLRRGAHRRTGRIDKNIDRPDRRLDRRDHRPGRSRINQIGRMREHLVSLRGEFCLGGGQRFSVASDYRNLRTLLRKAPRTRQTYALAAAGDQHHLAF